MSVKISELPALSTLADDDILAGVDTSENATSKITLATLKEYVDTNTQYTAGTNIDITNNVISAPDVYVIPSGGIPSTDMSSAVQTSLGKADTALQSHQDISGKEDKSNKVTSLSASSTDTQYPSAKCVYDLIGDLEDILEDLDTGSGLNGD